VRLVLLVWLALWLAAPAPTPAHELGVARASLEEMPGGCYLLEVETAALHPYTHALLSAIPQPDPERRRSRIVPRGDVPNPEQPPDCCPFHPRCPRAMDVCRTEAPEVAPARCRS